MFNKYVVDLVGCAKPGKAYDFRFRCVQQQGNLHVRSPSDFRPSWKYHTKAWEKKSACNFRWFFCSRLKFLVAQNGNSSEFRDISTVQSKEQKANVKDQQGIHTQSFQISMDGMSHQHLHQEVKVEKGKGKPTPSLAAMFWLSYWVQNSLYYP